MQIESLDEEIFTFKCKSLFQIAVNVLNVFITELIIQLMQFLALWIDLIRLFQVNMNSFS